MNGQTGGKTVRTIGHNYTLTYMQYKCIPLMYTFGNANTVKSMNMESRRYNFRLPRRAHVTKHAHKHQNKQLGEKQQAGLTDKTSPGELNNNNSGSGGVGTQSECDVLTALL